MEKPIVLVLTEWYLPGYKAGGQVRTIHGIIENLKDKIDFYVLTTNRDLGEKFPYKNIVVNEWVDQEGIKIKYLESAHPNISFYKDQITTVKPDFVYPNSLFSFRFSILPIIICKFFFRAQKIILAPRGMLGKGALSIKPIKKQLFITITKWINLFSGVLWHASTDYEKEEIESNYGATSKVFVATDLSPLSNNNAIIRTKKEVNKLNLVFISRISPKKNLLYAFDILYNLSSSIFCKYTIYGPIEDDGYWKKCQEKITQINKKGNIKISYDGVVHPNNLLNVFKDNHFFFMPTKHENYGHVFIEALFFATPLIISDNTPWLNLEYNNVGWDISLSNKSQFVNVLSQCAAMDNLSFQKLAECSILYAKERLNPESDILANHKLFSIG